MSNSFSRSHGAHRSVHESSLEKHFQLLSEDGIKYNWSRYAVLCDILPLAPILLNMCTMLAEFIQKHINYNERYKRN